MMFINQEKSVIFGAPFAGVVEWYTRTTQNRVAQALRVQVPPPAQNKGVKIEYLEIFEDYYFVAWRRDLKTF